MDKADIARQCAFGLSSSVSVASPELVCKHMYLRRQRNGALSRQLWHMAAKMKNVWAVNDEKVKSGRRKRKWTA